MVDRSVRRATRGAVAVVLSLVSAGSLAACGGSGPSGVTTVQVRRGTVLTSVATSGALSTVTSQNLGFPKGDKLVELDVHVGDTVRPGQVLARLDPFTTRQALDVARANLDQARAALDQIVHGLTVSNAQRFYQDSKKYIDALEQSRAASVAAARTAAHQAWLTYVYYHKQYRASQLALAACQGVPPPRDSDPDATRSREVPDFPGGTGSTSTSATASTGVSTTTGTATGTTATVADCSSQLTAAKSAYVSDVQYRTSYLAAQRAIATAAATANVSYWLGRFYYQGTARNGRDSAERDQPALVAKQSAAVRAAEALVQDAQRDVSDTVLIAPVAGTVSAINGTVGEYVGSGSGTSALAPGTGAAIPGVGAAASSDQAGNAASGISATKPGGSAFIVLNNLSAYQVVVPYEETDAAKIAANQPVQVTFDAVPDLEIDGTVLSVAPSGVNISGVTNYYATVLLDRSDPRLKNGLTAQAAITANRLDNVLTVPNAAVIHRDGRSFVQVPGPQGQPTQREFQPGAVGTDSTQVLAGLPEGQPVLITPPQGGG